MGTQTGTLQEIDFELDRSLWTRVCSDRSVCRGAKCSYNNKCFLQAARRRVQAILAGLGLSQVDAALPAGHLSGGQQTAARSPSAPGPAETPSDSPAPGDNNIDAE